MTYIIIIDYCRYTACLEVVTVISVDHYPAFKNYSLYSVDLPKTHVSYGGKMAFLSLNDFY